MKMADSPAPRWHYFAVAAAAALLFLPGLGGAHLFDWDEINFAECAREMMVTGDYLRVQIDFQPFWEKPPLFIWLQVLSMKVFGVNEYAARLPNALIGIVTLLTLLRVGTEVRNRTTGLVWVVLYAASWLPHFYFKSGIIDPLFNLLIFLAFYQTHRHAESVDGKMRHAAFAGVFLGLAVLTKGPVAGLVAALGLVVYVILSRGLGGLRIAGLALTAFTAAAVTSVWFGVEVGAHGWGLVQDFILYQIRLFRTEDADHGGPFFYHFLVLLVGCFPASVFLFQKKNGTPEPESAAAFRRWMSILFWVVLILFSIVKTKIVHYSSLCYFPLTFLAAQRIAALWETRQTPTRAVQVLLGVLGILLAIAITTLPVVGLNKDHLAPLIDDPFAVANLQADVPWHYAEAGWGILYLSGVVVALVWMRKSFRRAALLLAAVQVMVIAVAIGHFTPKIEGYSQRAAIRFFKGLRGEDAYVRVLGYKSYAQLFYTEKKPPHEPTGVRPRNDARVEPTTESLLTDPVQKPTYFIAKITAADQYRQMPQLEVIGEEAGFVFFRRRAVSMENSTALPQR